MRRREAIVSSAPLAINQNASEAKRFYRLVMDELHTDLVPFMDEKFYGTTQQTRMFGCTKPGEVRPFQLLASWKYKGEEVSIPEE